MSPLKSVEITTSDGVVREMRDTPGARKRVYDRFGSSNIMEIAAKQGDWVLFEVAWLMMFDRQGNPPAGLPLTDFLESSAHEDRRELFAAIMAATSNGVRSKNEVEALLAKAETSLAPMAKVDETTVQ